METSKELDNNKRPVISIILQIVGILLTVGGGLVLLCEGLGNVNSTSRFFSFCLIMLMAGILGVYLSVKRSDQKNARILIGIFLFFIPIFWSQLGAVIYSFYHTTSIMPEFLRVTGISLFTIIISICLGALVIAPLTYIVSKIFVLHISKIYSILLTAIGFGMCIPIRVGLTSDFIIVATVVLTTLYERNFFSKGSNANTTECKMGRFILLMAVFIVNSRALFYSSSPLILCSFWICISSLIFCLQNIWLGDKSRKNTIIPDLFICSGLSTLALHSNLPFTDSYRHFFAYTTPAIFLIIISRNIYSFHSKVAMLMLLAGSLCYKSDHEFISYIASIIFPLLAIGLGIKTRSLFILIIGICGLVLSSMDVFINIWSLAYEYKWSFLMIAGISIIFFNSYIEEALKKTFKSWQKN